MLTYLCRLQGFLAISHCEKALSLFSSLRAVLILATAVSPVRSRYLPALLLQYTAFYAHPRHLREGKIALQQPRTLPHHFELWAMERLQRSLECSWRADCSLIFQIVYASKSRQFSQAPKFELHFYRICKHVLGCIQFLFASPTILLFLRRSLAPLTQHTHKVFAHWSLISLAGFQCLVLNAYNQSGVTICKIWIWDASLGSAFVGIFHAFIPSCHAQFTGRPPTRGAKPTFKPRVPAFSTQVGCAESRTSVNCQ